LPGKSSKEKGRNAISSIILDVIKFVEINSINLKANSSLITNILEKEYENIFQPNNSFDQYKISPE
jgi:hypothetical protein